MDARERLYKKNNKCFNKTINIEEKLYKKLKKFSAEIYDATISQIINVAIENYVQSEEHNCHGKPKDEMVVYRTIMLRPQNLKDLQVISEKTGYSVTRLINTAIRELS